MTGMKKLLMWIFQPSLYGTLYTPCKTCMFRDPSAYPGLVYDGCSCIKVRGKNKSVLTGVIDIKDSKSTYTYRYGDIESNGKCGLRGRYWKPLTLGKSSSIIG